MFRGSLSWSYQVCLGASGVLGCDSLAVPVFSGTTMLCWRGFAAVALEVNLKDAAVWSLMQFWNFFPPKGKIGHSGLLLWRVHTVLAAPAVWYDFGSLPAGWNSNWPLSWKVLSCSTNSLIQECNFNFLINLTWWPFIRPNHPVRRDTTRSFSLTHRHAGNTSHEPMEEGKCLGFS